MRLEKHGDPLDDVLVAVGALLHVFCTVGTGHHVQAWLEEYGDVLPSAELAQLSLGQCLILRLQRGHVLLPLWLTGGQSGGSLLSLTGNGKRGKKEKVTFYSISF